MKFRPLHDWVVIKRSKPAEMTASGIIIPDAARDKPSEGVVAGVGPGRYKQEKGKKEKKFFPTVLKPGQKVMFIDYMAKDVELDGMEITLIREDDVLGIIEQSSELAVRKEYRVEIKKELPPMVQARPEKAGVAAGAKQPAKTIKKEKPAKSKGKTTTGKSAKKEKNV
ncbi:MAG: co-chaperone GroES, partial [Nitrospirae bacterium]|nr:co-chaperone GroES [Nitrospirota bacterium]